MNIYNLIYTLLFYYTTANVNIDGQISFELYENVNTNKKNYENITEEHKEQQHTSENSYILSEEKNNISIKSNGKLNTREFTTIKKFKIMNQQKRFSISSDVRPIENMFKAIVKNTSNDSIGVESGMKSSKNSKKQKNNQFMTTSANVRSEVIKSKQTQNRSSGHSNKMMTSAPLVECVYQYPEKKQVNAILSDMINHLAKICTPGNKIKTKEQRRSQNKRFRVVAKMDFAFEKAFLRMVKEFNNFIRNVRKNFKKDGNPCDHQKKLKRIWKLILNRAEATLKHASLYCTRKLLPYNKILRTDNSTSILGKLLVKEMSKIRIRHLEILCDKFQLCYNELL